MPIATMDASTRLEEMRVLHAGDPMDAAPAVGPPATEGGRAVVAEPVDDAPSHGRFRHQRVLQSEDGLEGLTGRGRAMERDRS